MTEMDVALERGFADPVLQAQSAFRSIMDALANPGSVQALVAQAPAHARLTSGLATVLLTLVDQDTPIWLGESLRSEAGVEQFIAFHTGAWLMSEPQRAAFAFAAASDELPRFDAFGLGTQEYPDRSTTVVLAVSSLGGGVEHTVRGPGIKGSRAIAPQGLPDDFVAQWSANRELFPRGIDLLLVTDAAVMGLPRSTRIAEGG